MFSPFLHHLVLVKTRLDQDSVHGINFTVYYSSIPCKISLNVTFVRKICLALRAQAFPRYCTHTPLFTVHALGKIFISVEVLRRLSRESGAGVDADDSSRLFDALEC